MNEVGKLSARRKHRFVQIALQILVVDSRGSVGENMVVADRSRRRYITSRISARYLSCRQHNYHQTQLHFALIVLHLHDQNGLPTSSCAEKSP